MFVCVCVPAAVTSGRVCPCLVVYSSAGIPKRSGDAEDAFAVSIAEWFALPRCLFVHAWVITGYISREKLAALTGVTEDQLQQARRDVVLGHIGACEPVPPYLDSTCRRSVGN